MTEIRDSERIEERNGLDKREMCPDIWPSGMATSITEPGLPSWWRQCATHLSAAAKRGDIREEEVPGY